MKMEKVKRKSTRSRPFSFFSLPVGAALLILLLASCFSENKDNSAVSDPFYTDARREDLDRLPLLKPLELYSADGDSWFFDLPFGEAEGQKQISCIMVGMKDSILVAYAGMVSFPGETTDAWFCLDLDNHTTTVFHTPGAFRSNAFNASVELHSVRRSARQFQQTGNLPWKKWIEERESH